MRNLWKSMLGLCVIGICPGVSALAQAASGVGPYYATPAWDQTLPAATRFIVLTNMNSEAVLDRETGLVWEQSPDSTERIWAEAHDYCDRKLLGGRLGWRLPAVQELASLVDRSAANQTGPALPPGHPFSNVRFSDPGFGPAHDVYWSATTNSSNADRAVQVSFRFGTVTGTSTSNKAAANYVWCVRGGQGVDPQ